MTTIMQRIERNVRYFQHVHAVAEEGKRKNAANRKLADDLARDKSREIMSERALVRSFGDKVKSVRYSGRADLVGLQVIGTYCGFLITKDASGRKLRVVEVTGLHYHVTKRYIRLRDNESVSNLQRGLLKWVR